jgi:hypothetical protein
MSRPKNASGWLKRSLCASFLVVACLFSAIAPAFASEFARLEATPSAIVLNGREARQRILITGVRSDGSRADLTDSAVIQAGDSRIVRIEAGVVLPQADGATRLALRAAGLSLSLPATVRNAKAPFRWSFENHIESILSKQGCNMGICHGGANGKGGFRLSLRAYAPEKDYDWLKHEGKGRRLALSAPDQSLLLRKPSLGIAHRGGLRLQKGTLEYRALREWIAAGAYGPESNAPHITRLEVSPAHRVLAPKALQRLLVTAYFSDGHS